MLRASLMMDLSALEGARQRARSGAPALRQIVGVWRGAVGQQLDSGQIDGMRWAPRKPFGDSPGGQSRLQKTGLLRGAWLGGPGSITKIGKQTATFGIDGDRIPYAVVHRGTAGPITAATFRRQTRIRVTERMRRFLAARRVYLRRSTTHLVIPARPHGAATAAVAKEAAEIYRDHLRERER